MGNRNQRRMKAAEESSPSKLNNTLDAARYYLMIYIFRDNASGLSQSEIQPTKSGESPNVNR